MKETTKQSSLKVNMIMNVILTVSSIIFPIITFPYVSRVVGAEGIGTVTFVTSVVTYFSMFAQLGIPTYGIRACAKVRDDKQELTKVVHEILILNTITCLISYVALAIALAIVPRFAEEKMLFVILSSTILLNALGVEWLYKALEQYSYITIRSLICKVVAFGALFVLVRSEQDYIMYGAVSIFAAAASNILNFLNLRKYISFRPVGNYHVTRHVKMVFVFFAMSIAITIYTNLDNVMLGFMQSDLEVGYYTAAVKVKSVLVNVVTAVSTVLLPRASYYVDKGLLEDFFKITRKAMNFVVLIAVPCTIYFMVYAKEGILLLSGEGFENAILPMQIIMPTLIFIGMTNILGIQMMVPLGKEKIVLYSTIWGAIVDLIVNALTIPTFGAAGAAFGTLIAELVVLIYQVIVTKDMSKKVLSGIRWHVVLLGCATGVLCGLWAKALNLAVFWVLVVSAVCFFGAYLVILLLAKETVVFEVLNVVLDKIKKKEVKDE